MYYTDTNNHTLHTALRRAVMMVVCVVTTLLTMPAAAQVVIGGDVYGGGKMGAVEDSDKSTPSTTVVINNGSVRTVFGGGQEGEKVIYTYSYGGQAKNGLIYPCYRSTTGTGRTWYTTGAEHDRFKYYYRSGNRPKCKELIDALLRYNVTTEYYQAERYDDHDAYIAPWLPNASANGRLLDMLFDYYGATLI